MKTYITKAIFQGSGNKHSHYWKKCYSNRKQQDCKRLEWNRMQSFWSNTFLITLLNHLLGGTSSGYCWVLLLDFCSNFWKVIEQYLKEVIFLPFFYLVLIKIVIPDEVISKSKHFREKETGSISRTALMQIKPRRSMSQHSNWYDISHTAYRWPKLSHHNDFFLQKSTSHLEPKEK